MAFGAFSRYAWWVAVVDVEVGDGVSLFVSNPNKLFRGGGTFFEPVREIPR